MKKLLLLSSVLLFGAMNAQTTFGLKAGYANSKLSGEGSEDMDLEGVALSNKTKSGFFVGAFVEHKFNDKVALQGEIQYANLGGQMEGKVDVTEEGQNVKFTLVDKLNFNQIVVPVSVKYFATPQFAVYAGPSVSFNAGYKSDIKIKNANFPTQSVSEEINYLEANQDETMKEYLKSTSFNIFFGAEYQFYKSFSVDARYSVGLTNYEKEETEGSSTKMNYFQIGLGYRFK